MGGSLASLRAPGPDLMPPTDPLPITERANRARRISTTFGRVYLGVKSHQWIARTLSPPDMDARWSQLHRGSAHRIHDLAVDLRGMILKACQFMSARPDVLPPEYIEILGRLQDRVPAHPFEHLRAEVELAVGGPIERVFAELDPEPLAAASLAQVHVGVLPGGERVAVKIQYPEIEALVRHDLANLHLLFRAVGLVERDLDVMPLFRELQVNVPRELDFTREADAAERVGGFFSGREDVRVPGLYRDLSSRRVLVMERIDGIKIDDTEALSREGIDVNVVMRTLIEAYCEQIFVHGVFHADPHPGNLMVEVLEGERDDGSRRFCIVFLDFGLTKTLPKHFRRATAEFAAALLGGDARAMAESLEAMGFETRRGGVEQLERITEIVLRTAAKLRQQAFVDRDVVQEAAGDLPRMIRENPIVRVPGHLVLVGRVIALLTGLGHHLQARVDMIPTILPYVMGVVPTSKPATPDSLDDAAGAS